MTKIMCSLEHPIVFILDYENEDAEIPEYDQYEVVSANKYCLSVRAISDVDGEVTIGLNEPDADISSPSEIEVFVGMIGVPNRKVAVVNSQNEIILQSEVNSDSVGVRVIVDDIQHPSKIWVSTFNP